MKISRQGDVYVKRGIKQKLDGFKDVEITDNHYALIHGEHLDHVHELYHPRLKDVVTIKEKKTAALDQFHVTVKEKVLLRHFNRRTQKHSQKHFFVILYPEHGSYLINNQVEQDQLMKRLGRVAD